TVSFRIVDERYKPVSEIPEKQQNVSVLSESNQKVENVSVDNSWKRGLPVEFPTGFGVLIVPEQDVNGVVIVMAECGEYRRVAADAIKPIKSERDQFHDAALELYDDNTQVWLDAMFNAG